MAACSSSSRLPSEARCRISSCTETAGPARRSSASRCRAGARRLAARRRTQGQAGEPHRAGGGSGAYTPPCRSRARPSTSSPGRRPSVRPDRELVHHFLHEGAGLRRHVVLGHRNQAHLDVPLVLELSVAVCVAMIVVRLMMTKLRPQKLTASPNPYPSTLSPRLNRRTARARVMMMSYLLVSSSRPMPTECNASKPSTPLRSP